MTLKIFKVTTRVRQPGAIGAFYPMVFKVAAQDSITARRLASNALIDLGWETCGTVASDTGRTHESGGARSLLLETPEAPKRPS